MLTASLALCCPRCSVDAALYVSFVEDPARAKLVLDKGLRRLAIWQPSYKRGAVMQASLAVVAFLVGAAAWRQSDNWIFALGALFQILPWPWTLLVIMPTNRALLKLTPGQAGPESQALLKRWGRLAAMRTLLRLWDARWDADIPGGMFDFARVRGLKPRPLSGKPLRLSGPPPGAGDRPQAAQVRPLGRNCLEFRPNKTGLSSWSCLCLSPYSPV